MSDLQPITLALNRVAGKPVVVFSRDEWERLVSDTGEPTIADEVPKPLSKVMAQATIVTVTASGVINPFPGIDIVRYDAKDAPYVYNIDHYTVIENFSEHEQYTRVLTMARIEDNEEIRTTLQENVFVIGPERLGHHWSKELPEHIRKAKSKR